MTRHFTHGVLAHSSLYGNVQAEEFLEDYASFLLLAGYLYEEGKIERGVFDSLFQAIQKFYKNGEWIESDNKDFMEVKAGVFDNPVPSSIGIVHFAIYRYYILTQQETEKIPYGAPL